MPRPGHMYDSLFEDYHAEQSTFKVSTVSMPDSGRHIIIKCHDIRGYGE